MLANFGIGTLAHDPENACPGHSRSKNGVASLAYDPGLTDFSDKIMRKGKNSMSLCFEIGPP